jgi:HEAT repeat protein
MIACAVAALSFVGVAVWWCAHRGDQVEPVGWLKDPEWYVRADAAEELGNSGDPRAVQRLIAALNDATWVVRRRAAEGLAKLGDARAVEPLIRCLKEGNAELRDAATEALRKLGKPSLEPLTGCLQADRGQVLISD